MTIEQQHKVKYPWKQTPFIEQFFFSFSSYFEFRICPNLAAKQECLDKNVLELLGGTPSQPQPGDLSTRFYPRNGSRIYDIKGKLPPGKGIFHRNLKDRIKTHLFHRN